MWNLITKCAFLLIGISLNIPTLLSQLAPNKYWVQFTDKDSTPFSMNSPEEFLSSRSLNRRSKQNIAITSQDLPVDPEYIDSLKQLGLEIHNTSKWFNGVVVNSTDTDLLDTLHLLSFVKDPVNTLVLKASKKIDKYPKSVKSAINYGQSERQIKMLGGDHLHTNDFNGEGMLIAVLDNGFKGAPNLESFADLWQNNQIIEAKDFVKDNIDIYNSGSHGTLVLSVIGGVIPNNLYGSAPKSNFVLVRTEDSNSEFLVEEYNWISGAEYADSIGADIINSSLGYALFDDPSQDHTYADMDGYTTPVSIAANIAARKGILVVNSAGNSGTAPWYYITAPADADSILTIGAVNSSEVIANFSSRGPSYDMRTKPDIVAMGVSTYGQTNNGYLAASDGTSLSSPLIAGLSACLWQTFPDASAEQLRQAIIKSSNRYSNPDNEYGYGLPNFEIARLLLIDSLLIKNKLINFSIRPNPAKDIAYLVSYFPNIIDSESGFLEIYELSGRLVNYKSVEFHTYDTIEIPDVEKLEQGFYILRIAVYGHNYQLPFIKN